MLDNDLINLVATQLEAASAAAGWNYIVVQKDEPTQQGTPTAPTIFFEKLFDHAHGWPMDSYEYQATPNNFLETETQVYETTFQISALVIQDPTNLSLPTSSDVANFMKQYIAARWSIAAFQAQGVGIFRVTSVRNPPFVDDRTLYEYNPNFDVIFTHSRSVSGTINAANRAVPSEVGVVPIGSSTPAPVPLPSGVIAV